MSSNQKARQLFRYLEEVIVSDGKVQLPPTTATDHATVFHNHLDCRRILNQLQPGSLVLMRDPSERRGPVGFYAEGGSFETGVVDLGGRWDGVAKEIENVARQAMRDPERIVATVRGLPYPDGPRTAVLVDITPEEEKGRRGPVNRLIAVLHQRDAQEHDS